MERSDVQLLIAVGEALASDETPDGVLSAAQRAISAHAGVQTEILSRRLPDNALEWKAGSRLGDHPQREGIVAHLCTLLGDMSEGWTGLFIPRIAEVPEVPPSVAASLQDESILALPLRHRSRTVGLLLVWTELEKRPDVAQADILAAVATQLALAVASNQYHEAEHAALAQTSLLLEMANLLGGTRSLDDVLATASLAVRERLGVDSVVMLLDPDTGYLIGKASSHLTAEQLRHMRAAPGRSPLFAALRDGFVHLPRAGDVTVAPAFIRESPTFAEEGQLAVRVEHRGQPLGVLFLWGLGLRTVSEAFLALCRGVGQQVGLAVQNAKVHDRLRLQARTDELTGVGNHRWFQEEILAALWRGEPFALLLLDLDHFKQINDLNGHQGGDRVLRKMAQTVRDRLPRCAALFRYGGEEFAVLLPNARGERAREVAEVIRTTVVTHIHLNSDLPEPISVSVGIACFPDHATQKDELIHCADMALYEAKTAGRNRVCLHDPEKAVLIRSASMDGDVMTSLYTLMTLLRSKDLLTFRHSQRVAQAAGTIARHLGLPHTQVTSVELGGILHDIGKLAVDRQLLASSRRLTETELADMQRHPLEGARFVAAFPTLQGALPAIRSHHERWNGEGYPQGLRGDAIPLDARIVAVADVLDTMIHGRPHQAPRPWADAVAELRRGASAQFDPSIVDVVVNLAPGDVPLLFGNTP